MLRGEEHSAPTPEGWHGTGGLECTRPNPRCLKLAVRPEAPAQGRRDSGSRVRWSGWSRPGGSR